MKENYLKLPSWLRTNRFFRKRLTGSHSEPYNKEKEQKQPGNECHPYDANLISSEKLNGKHVLMIDLDVEHFYTQSSSEKHGHLYVNKELDFESMTEILDVLTKHGIVQGGFTQATKDRGYAALRLPGQDKGYENDRWFYDALTESEFHKKLSNEKEEPSPIIEFHSGISSLTESIQKTKEAIAALGDWSQPLKVNYTIDNYTIDIDDEIIDEEI